MKWVIIALFTFLVAFAATTVMNSAFGEQLPDFSLPLEVPKDLSELGLGTCNGTTVLIWMVTTGNEKYSIAVSDYRWIIYRNLPTQYAWLGHFTEQLEVVVDKEFPTFKAVREAYPGGCRWLSLGPPI